MDKDKNALWERYEDAAFAILMHTVAEQEGEKAFQLLDELEQDPSAQLPEEVKKQAEQTIRKAFAAQGRRSAKHVGFRIFQRIAVAVLVVVLTATCVFAAFPEVRANLYNLIIREYEDHTEFNYAEHFSDQYSSADFTIEPGWLPDGFTLSDEGQVDSLIYKTYKNNDVAEAWKVGLHKSSIYTDYRQPVPRGLFGEDASRLVALAFGGNYDAYNKYQAIQCQIKDQSRERTVAEELGLLKGREDGSLDYDTAITRQEAAVVLARAYRCYCDEIHDDAEPLSYADNGNIADWAKTDVQLMTHLGIMNGIGENKFDPQGPYTLEQCLVTLVRLYDNTCKGKPTVKNDFFSVTPRQAAISQAYMPNYYLCSAENDKTFAIAYNMGTGHMGPIDIKVFVVDANGVCKGYRNAIKTSHNIYWGEGEDGQSDANIEKIWLSDDGSKVYYQSTVKENVYPYYPNGTYGKLR